MPRKFSSGANSYLIATSGLPSAITGGGTTVHTVCCWVKPAALAVSTAVGSGKVSGSGYIALGPNASGEVFAESAGDSWAPTKINTTQWWHIGYVVQSGNNVRSFVNGVPASSAVSAVSASAQTAFSIGALMINGGMLSYFKGEVAHVAVYSGELSEAQAKELAAKKNPTKVLPEKLVGYWTLDGKSSTKEPSYEEKYGPTLEVGLGVENATSDPEIEAPGGAEEKHSGSVSLSGGGSIATEGSKSSQSTASINGGGSVAVTGTAEDYAAVTLSGGGTAEITGIKDTSGSASIDGGGEVSANGVKGAERSVSIDGGGSASPLGQKEAVVAISTDGGGSIEVEGRAGIFVGVTLSGGGSAETVGEKGVSGTVSLNGGGEASLGLTTGRFESVVVNGGGGISVSDEKFIFEQTIGREADAFLVDYRQRGIAFSKEPVTSLTFELPADRSLGVEPVTDRSLALAESTNPAAIIDVSKRSLSRDKQSKTGLSFNKEPETDAKNITPRRSLK